MTTMTIALKCPLCGRYMDYIAEHKAGCTMCGAILDMERVSLSAWYESRAAQRERLHKRDEILPAGPWERGGGSKSGRKKQKKPVNRRPEWQI